MSASAPWKLDLLLTGHGLPQEAKEAYGHGCLLRENTHVIGSSIFIACRNNLSEGRSLD